MHIKPSKRPAPQAHAVSPQAIMRGALTIIFGSIGLVSGAALAEAPNETTSAQSHGVVLVSGMRSTAPVNLAAVIIYNGTITSEPTNTMITNPARVPTVAGSAGSLHDTSAGISHGVQGTSGSAPHIGGSSPVSGSGQTGQKK